MSYDFKNIEKKWQKIWQGKPDFQTQDNFALKKFYCLDMFPYPSASGLHVGHWKGYVFSDVFSRKKALEGHNILHPMGWDAFGLPAENDAIKKGQHPKANTQKNINTFKEQLQKIGALYDWSKEINTTDPEYYRWTQWIFLKMFEAGLAYQEFIPVNWCPKCLTGLANEEASGGQCDRCSTEVEQKPLRQWVLKITQYADSLYDDLDELEWPEKVKLMQKNWIGRSHGAEVDFECNGTTLKVYTTRPDTLAGCTFMVMAPDHDLVEKIITPKQAPAIAQYQEKVKNMTDIQRQLDKDKDGVFTGSYATNPLTGTQVPVYLSSYVLKNYGTGVIMAVPAHDERDFDFAIKFDLPIVQVYRPAQDDPNLYDGSGNLKQALAGEGVMLIDDQFKNMQAPGEASEAIIAYLESKGAAAKKTQYKLRDWVFSRQRYWGEPIPLIHCTDCGVVGVPEDQLPVRLPEVDNYQPTGTGESPLATVEDWVSTSCPKCDRPAKRETNTMPQWAGSCWYFLRYLDPNNNHALADKESLKHWMPVDLYVGGIEHAVLHLLYARFYVKFLHDQGYLNFKEPFKKLFNQGMVCMKSETTGRVEKMSKSKGNVVCPDTIVDDLGSDTLRMYMLFMGPPELDTEWQADSIKGVHSFLSRLWTYLTNPESRCQQAEVKTQKLFHRFLKNFTQRLEAYKVNTAVSAAMEFLNGLTKGKLQLDQELMCQFLTVLSVMVPHFASELLEKLCETKLTEQVWPTFDEKLAAEDTIQLPVQINGKLRTVLEISHGATKSEVEDAATKAVEKWLEGKQVRKVIFVPGRLLNFVV